MELGSVPRSLHLYIKNVVVKTSTGTTTERSRAQVHHGLTSSATRRDSPTEPASETRARRTTGEWAIDTRTRALLSDEGLTGPHDQSLSRALRRLLHPRYRVGREGAVVGTGHSRTTSFPTRVLSSLGVKNESTRVLVERQDTKNSNINLTIIGILKPYNSKYLKERFCSVVLIDIVLT